MFYSCIFATDTSNFSDQVDGQIGKFSSGLGKKIILFGMGNGAEFWHQIWVIKSTGMMYDNRASVKRTYGVYYALRLPPDVQIELQRRTADFRNFFYPSKIDTRDVQNRQKPRPLLTSCIMFAPPIYRKFTTCVH